MSTTPDAMSDAARVELEQSSRRAMVVVCSVAAAISAVAVLLVAAAWRDDCLISSQPGTATAEVLSAGRLRSTISFVTPDGRNHNPKLGVLYPTNLTAGQSIGVEYATNNPELVRVAGRDARVALLPAGSVIAGAWLCATMALALSRHRVRRFDCRSTESPNTMSVPQ